MYVDYCAARRQVRCKHLLQLAIYLLSALTLVFANFFDTHDEAYHHINCNLPPWLDPCLSVSCCLSASGKGDVELDLGVVLGLAAMPSVCLITRCTKYEVSTKQGSIHLVSTATDLGWPGERQRFDETLSHDLVTNAANVPTGGAVLESDFSLSATPWKPANWRTHGTGDETAHTGPKRFGKSEQVGPIRTASVHPASDTQQKFC